MNLYPLLRGLLFRLDAERAHELSLRLMSMLAALGLLRPLLRLLGARPVTRPMTARPVELMGLRFPSRVGLAAGLDKNAAHLRALEQCGFGFIEVGTVTPRGQPGNSRPRMFRLVRDRAIINRMGFNNDGVEALVAHVARYRARGGKALIGINIGKNKSTPLENAVDDYLFCLQKVYALADYVTVNISSPNTPGLRQLQHGEGLRRLLARLCAEREALAAQSGRRAPLLVKIAPDLSDADLDEIVDTLVESAIDGVIASNTTNQRPPGLRETALAEEAGGLSGAPLTPLADALLEKLLRRLEGRLPVIAVGGIMRAEDARRKLAMGAALVQVYTGFIYSGPALVRDISEAIE